MDLVFEKGNEQEPRGHALLYFQNSSEPEEIWCTYLVVLPVSVDVSKYMPPFLMNQVSELGPSDLSAFAFPPAPEKIDGRKHLEELAKARGDDVLFGGSLNPTDVTTNIMYVSEAVQRYADMYTEAVPARATQEGASGEEAPGLAVSEVLYGLMSDTDKLAELTKLVGKLRFTVESSEESLMNETEVDLNLLAKHMPDNHQIQHLIEATKDRGERGTRLTDLYLQRCFHLMQQEFVKLGDVEAEIKTLESPEPSP